MVKSESETMWETADADLDVWAAKERRSMYGQPGILELLWSRIRLTLLVLQSEVVLCSQSFIRENRIGYVECFCLFVYIVLFQIPLLVRMMQQDELPVTLPDFVLCRIVRYLESLIVRL